MHLATKRRGIFAAITAAALLLSGAAHAIKCKGCAKQTTQLLSWIGVTELEEIENEHTAKVTRQLLENQRQLVKQFGIQLISDLVRQNWDVSKLAARNNITPADADALLQWRENWSATQDQILRLMASIDNGQSIAYGAANAERQFARVYEDYPQQLADSGQFAHGQNYTDLYGKWQDTAIATIQRVLAEQGFRYEDFSSEKKARQAMRAAGSSARGQLGILQATNEVALSNAQQQRRLRAILKGQVSTHTAVRQAAVSAELAEIEQWILMNAPNTSSNAQ